MEKLALVRAIGVMPLLLALVLLARGGRAQTRAIRLALAKTSSSPRQPPKAPLALEPADVAAVGLDFVPDSFVHGPVKKGGALVTREGDFGFSKANGTPEEGHDFQLVNFSRPGEPLELELSRFARNSTFEQAFVSRIRGINRPVDGKFGPDGAFYWVDYGAVRDFGQSDPEIEILPTHQSRRNPQHELSRLQRRWSAPWSAPPDPGHRRDLEDQPHRRRGRRLRLAAEEGEPSPTPRCVPIPTHSIRRGQSRLGGTGQSPLGRAAHSW